MKIDSIRKPRASRLKSQDMRSNEEANESQILTLYSRLNISEIKYSDLSSRVQKFVSEIFPYLNWENLPHADQEKIQNEIAYFQNSEEIDSTCQLFSKFRQDLIEKLNGKEFNRENFKNFIISGISELTVSTRENSVCRKRNTILDEKRDFTPVRSNKRSTSPGEKHSVNYQKENIELKNNLSEIMKQRDILKAWKDNLIKFPNLDAESQKIIKDLKEENELTAMKVNCNLSKLIYIVNSVQKFLNNTSKFQKQIREKEGYASVNLYEDERSKLEMKIREVIDNNDTNWKPSSPVRPESELKITRMDLGSRSDVRKKSRDFGVCYSEKINSRLIEEVTKQYAEKVDGLTSTINKLENDNRKLKNKYFVVKKEMKQVKNADNKKKVEIFETIFQQKLGSLSMFKKLVEKQMTSFSVLCEKTWKNIKDSIEEKNRQIFELKAKLCQVIKNKLASDNYANEQNEEKFKEIIQNSQMKLENLHKSLHQSRKDSDSKAKELESKLKEVEKIKAKHLIKIETLEKEVSVLTKEKNFHSDFEKILKQKNDIIQELESSRSHHLSHIKALEQCENLSQQYKVQRDLLESENKRILEDLKDKANSLLESEQKRKRQEEDSKKIIENLVLEKKKLLDVLIVQEYQGHKVKNLMNYRTPDSQESKPDPSYKSSVKDPNQPVPQDSISTQEHLKLKKQLIFMQVHTESLELELARVRENSRNFENCLKYRLKQLETGQIAMSRVDMKKYT